MEHRILSNAPGYRESWADDHAEGDFRAYCAFDRPQRTLSQVLNDLDDEFTDELSGDFGLPDGEPGFQAGTGH